MHIFNDAFCDYASESLGRLDLLMLTTVFLKLEFKNIEVYRFKSVHTITSSVLCKDWEGTQIIINFYSLDSHTLVIEQGTYLNNFKNPLAGCVSAIKGLTLLKYHRGEDILFRLGV